MDPIENQDGALENTDVQEKVVEKVETKEPDWKAEAAKWKRIADRNAKKAETTDAEPVQEKKPSTSDLDYGQKAFLKASGISGADETALVKEFMKRTGDSLDSVIEDDIFKARLEKLRTTKSNELAAEGNTGRGNTANGRMSVEYWLAKGEHPPKELGREIAEKYVEARRSKGKSTSMFYND